MTIPDGLVRCGQRGELRGEFLYQDRHDPEPGLTRVRCLCAGIVCRYCRTNAIHRPVSAYYHEATATVWNVASFGYLFPCRECRSRRRRKALVLLARRRPWVLVRTLIRRRDYDDFEAGGGLSVIITGPR